MTPLNVEVSEEAVIDNPVKSAGVIVLNVPTYFAESYDLCSLSELPDVYEYVKYLSIVKLGSKIVITSLNLTFVLAVYVFNKLNVFVKFIGSIL